MTIKDITGIVIFALLATVMYMLGHGAGYEKGYGIGVSDVVNYCVNTGEFPSQEWLDRKTN